MATFPAGFWAVVSKVTKSFEAAGITAENCSRVWKVEGSYVSERPGGTIHPPQINSQIEADTGYILILTDELTTTDFYEL